MAIKGGLVRGVDLRRIKRSKAHARQSEVAVNVDQLAASIARQGLLKPVLLIEQKKNESYELIDGQRRFLAYRELEKTSVSYSSIDAIIYENTMEEWEKKALSVAANITQMPIKNLDKTNAIAVIYNHFGGNISKMEHITGIPEETKKICETYRVVTGLKT